MWVQTRKALARRVKYCKGMGGRRSKMSVVNVISVSGGKDYTAMWLVAVESGANHIPVFADTGHEHPLTYDYLDYLEGRLGKITRVKADFTERIENKREYVKTKWRE